MIAPGRYAQKQLLSRSGLVRWSHGSRFRLGRRLVTPFAGRRMLDYGCGDGTFIALVRDLFPSALGVDAAADHIADCAVRFASLPGISFLTTDRLAGPDHRGRYDIIVCMEVLEHCPDDTQRFVLDEIRDVMAPGGVLVVSVPIEIGPPLVAKQGARALVALRGAPEYAARERYRAGELLRLLLAGTDTAFPREEQHSTVAGRVDRFTGHKGFNWRALEREIARRFTIERRLFSPLPLMGAWLNSQVWFVCRGR